MTKQKQESGLQIFQSNSIALNGATDIKTILKDSVGKYVAFENKAVTEKQLRRVSNKHLAYLEKMAELDELTSTQIKRIERIKSHNQKTRFALQNLRDHNAKFFSEAGKIEKKNQEEFIGYVKPNEDLAAKVIEDNKTKAETKERERKERIQLMIDEVSADLQKVITDTDDFDKIDANIEAFKKIAVAAKKDKNFEDMADAFNEMVGLKTSAFDALITEITTAHDLEISNAALNIANLKSERLETLMDYGYRYKAEKPLGELTAEEWTELLTTVILEYRHDELLKLGFIHDDGVYYYMHDEVSIYYINADDMVSYSFDEWEIEREDILKEIEILKTEPEEETAEIEPETETQKVAEIPEISAAENTANEIEVIETPVNETPGTNWIEEVSEVKPEMISELTNRGTHTITDSNFTNRGGGNYKSIHSEVSKAANSGNKNIIEGLSEIQINAQIIMLHYSNFRKSKGENELSIEHIHEFISTLK